MRGLLITIVLLLSALVSAQTVTHIKFEAADENSGKVLSEATYKMSSQIKYSIPSEVGKEGYVVTPRSDGSPNVQNVRVASIDRKNDYVLVTSMIITKGVLLPSYITLVFTDTLEMVMISEYDSFKGVVYYTTFYLQ